MAAAEQAQLEEWKRKLDGMKASQILAHARVDHIVTATKAEYLPCGEIQGHLREAFVTINRHNAT